MLLSFSNAKRVWGRYLQDNHIATLEVLIESCKSSLHLGYTKENDLAYFVFQLIALKMGSSAKRNSTGSLKAGLEATIEADIDIRHQNITCQIFLHTLMKARCSPCIPNDEGELKRTSVREAIRTPLFCPLITMRYVNYTVAYVKMFSLRLMIQPYAHTPITRS